MSQPSIATTFAPLSRALALLALVACNAGDPGETDGGATNTQGPMTTAGTTAGSTAGATAGSTGATAGTDTDPPDDAACGDGEVDPGEVCDGDALMGMTCADVEPGTVGALACAADCMSLDASGCAPPAAVRVVINEVTSKGAMSGPYADLGDAIELTNVGTEVADLAGWRLADDETMPLESTYVFPPGATLAPGAHLVLVRLDLESGVGDFPFGIASMGEETLTLVDADGKLVDQRTLLGEDALESYCGLPDGAGAWDRCDQTLGAQNAALSKICGNDLVESDEPCDGLDLGVSACSDFGFTEGDLTCRADCTLDTSLCASASPVAINELEAVDDRIELHNTDKGAVDITGWILTDKALGPDYDPATDLDKLVFPAVTSIPGGGFLVIHKGDKIGEHPFGLSTEGDTVTLFKPNLTPISQVTYGPDQAATSFCRTPDGKSGTWAAGCTPTFGGANTAP